MSPTQTSQIVPLVELPRVCETQLRGADTDHWEALLDYFEAAGTGVATAPPPAHGKPALAVGCGQRSAPALRADGADSKTGGGGGGGYEPTAAGLARGKSIPTLALLRTATNGELVDGRCGCHAMGAGLKESVSPLWPVGEQRPLSHKLRALASGDNLYGNYSRSTHKLGGIFTAASEKQQLPAPPFHSHGQIRRIS